MIDHINVNQNKHIITIEDPVEYIHKHKKSLIEQKEI
jgi:twitching motility protein PilT